MTSLADIQGHIASMDALLDIVGAMRSLAGMRVREAQRMLPGIRQYAESMAAGIGSALLLIPAASETLAAGGSRAVILFLGEHGFVGGFNERLIDAAEAVLAPSDLLFALGSRGAALLKERGLHAHWIRPMATRLAGAPETVNHLTSELYARIARGEISRVEVIFDRPRDGERQAMVERRLLLPLDLSTLAATQARQAPLHNLAPQSLLEKLISEYVFAMLTEAAVESIASENAARFKAMEAARDNVTKKLSQLHLSAQQVRQTEITAELLDLMTGAEASSGAGSTVGGR